MAETLESPARLEVDHITVGYDGTPILRNVSFHVPHGARVAVVGPNGAGKSTLFKALVGLLPLKEGRILIHDKPLGHHLDCVAYVPQREEVDWRFPVTVRDVVLMGRLGHQKWLQRASYIDRDIVHRSLTQMHITDIASRSIRELSGGQQQRVFLARALAQEPHIFLMDEPFTGVDATTQAATLDLLDLLREKQVTVLISTHDLNLAGSRFDFVLLLNHQLIAYGEPKSVFTPENLTKAFGSQMLQLPNGAVLVDDCCPPGEHDHPESPQ